MASRARGGKPKNAQSEPNDKLQDELRQAKLRIETLERYLVLRTEQTQRARTDQEEMKHKLRQLDEDFEKEKVERFNIASDMIRQYKSMQETMISRLNDSEKKRANLKDQLGMFFILSLSGHLVTYLSSHMISSCKTCSGGN
jgi:chromosome segregation ATPase